jgi:hypothetical protein
MNFEMAEADNPEQIIMATQRSLIESMREVLKGLKENDGQIGKQPGLTWEQIDYFLVGFRDKKPTIIHQEKPV